jgi:hypothetical protein
MTGEDVTEEERLIRSWSVDEEGDGWVFSYICHESEDAYPTREAALEALVDLLAQDNQELLVRLSEEA